MYFLGAIPSFLTLCLYPLLRSELTKDEMQAQLTSRARILFWASIVLGSLSVGLVGHAIYRYLS